MPHYYWWRVCVCVFIWGGSDSLALYHNIAAAAVATADIYRALYHHLHFFHFHFPFIFSSYFLHFFLPPHRSHNLCWCEWCVYGKLVLLFNLTLTHHPMPFVLSIEQAKRAVPAKFLCVSVLGSSIFIAIDMLFDRLSHICSVCELWFLCRHVFARMLMLNAELK